MAKKPLTLRYKMADAGLFFGALGSVIYAGVTADGEGTSYISDFAKQLVSKPIVPLSIAGFYMAGGLADAMSGLVNFLTKINKNLEQKLE